MAAKKRKSYIITAQEDIGAAEIAATEVAGILGDVEVVDSLSTMSGDTIPSKDAVLTNDDFGIITANLTDAEATSLAKKKGVDFVEPDEEVFATSDFTDGDDFDSESLQDLVDVNDEDTAEIDSEGSLDDDLSDEEAARLAELAAETAPDLGDEIDFDEEGNAFALDSAEDPVVADAFSSAGIPKEKIAKLIKCIIMCAKKELGKGGASNLSEDQIAAILSTQGLIGSQASVQAIRDYITCGLKIIFAPQAWRRSTGYGVRVAIVDTGIANRHPDLRVFGGVSYVPGVRSWNDDHGHGTHVAGTVAAIANNRGVVGVAPHARLYAVKVLSRSGSGSTSSVLNGLGWCYRYRMHVANLSLGSIATTHSRSNYSRAYERAGRFLRARGVLAVAAAGNSGRTSRPYVGNPARCPSFMAVSAVDCKCRRPRFSSYGPQVEICAPGVDVWSTYPPNRYRKLSGTSMAAPHVAGVAALVKRRFPSISADSNRIRMRSRARDLGARGRDWAYGYGLVNAYRSVI